MLNRSLKILILEDNDDLRDGLMSFFQKHGHYVRGAAMADELLDETGDFMPDVYVIDLNLPDADGLDVVRRLRTVHPSVAIVVTTARTEIGDKVLGYESGADIYFSKPVNPHELMAGIASLAKRREPVPTDISQLCLQLDHHRLSGPNGSVDLKPSETKLLAGLARAAGQPLERWQIAELLATGTELPADAMLEMRVARLRKKLASAGAAPPGIRAVYGHGYLLICPVILQ